MNEDLERKPLLNPRQKNDTVRARKARIDDGLLELVVPKSRVYLPITSSWSGPGARTAITELCVHGACSRETCKLLTSPGALSNDTDYKMAASNVRWIMMTYASLHI